MSAHVRTRCEVHHLNSAERRMFGPLSQGGNGFYKRCNNCHISRGVHLLQVRSTQKGQHKRNSLIEDDFWGETTSSVTRYRFTRSYIGSRVGWSRKSHTYIISEKCACTNSTQITSVGGAKHNTATAPPVTITFSEVEVATRQLVAPAVHQNFVTEAVGERSHTSAAHWSERWPCW